MLRRDIPKKMTGGAAYVQDVRLPGMVFGRVVRPPSPGARLVSFDEAAVKRMLPKNKLAAHMLSKLNVYKGDKHPHQAQKPQDLKLEVREYKAAKAAVS